MKKRLILPIVIVTGIAMTGFYFFAVAMGCWTSECFNVFHKDVFYTTLALPVLGWALWEIIVKNNE